MSCVYSEKLVNKLLKLNEKANNKIDIVGVKRAIYFAKKYHGDQKRQSGEPYYSHPLEVAYMVSDYLLRTDIIITAILHDTIEDTELTQEMIAIVFGEQIASQVADLTRVKSAGKISSAEMVELLYQQKKYDLLLIKLFDRLHNMQTIGAKSPEKVQKILKETLEKFIIITTYLEIPLIQENLVKLCYQNLSYL
jgi:(p)ppGpp synthase/HD superfamily hydrolase